MTKPYYKKQNITLYKGNSLKIIKELEKENFNMIFVDPPYFLSGKGITKGKGDWDNLETLEQKTKFHKSWITHCKKLLKPAGTMWITGTFHSIHTIGHLLTKEGFEIINEIAWHKNKNIPSLTKRQFAHSHETILWVKKKSTKHYFNHNLAKTKKWLDSIWYISPPKKEETKFTRHPTQKPTKLLQRIILTSTKKEDNILDPFLGSGTTAVVANYYNRKLTGIEKEEKYLKTAINRLENLHFKTNL